MFSSRPWWLQHKGTAKESSILSGSVFDFKVPPPIHQSPFITSTSSSHWHDKNSERKLTRKPKSNITLLKSQTGVKPQLENGLSAGDETGQSQDLCKSIDFHVPEGVTNSNSHSRTYYEEPTKATKQPDFILSHIQYPRPRTSLRSLFKYVEESTGLYCPSTPALNGNQPLWRLNKPYRDTNGTSLPPLSENEEAMIHPSLSLRARGISISTTPRYSRTQTRRMERMVMGSASLDKAKKVAEFDELHASVGHPDTKMVDLGGYPNALIDGPPKYQKRLAQLLGLVSDTMRNEKESKCKSRCRAFINNH